MKPKEASNSRPKARDSKNRREGAPHEGLHWFSDVGGSTSWGLSCGVAERMAAW